MIRKNFKIILLSIIIVLCFAFVKITFAADDSGLLTYTPMEVIDGLTPEKMPVNLSDYLNRLYVFLIAFSSVIAVVMITIGGFTYILSASSGGKEDGKGMIKNAIFGLLLMFLSYLIVNTVNPSALDFNIFKNATPIKPVSLEINTSGEGQTALEGLDPTKKGQWALRVVSPENSEIRYYDTQVKCLSEKESLSEATTAKYKMPATSQCTAKTMNVDKVYYFTYDYKDWPDRNVVETTSWSATGKTNSIATTEISETTMEACKQKKEEVIAKALDRKPYRPTTACTSLHNSENTNQFNFSFIYPYGETEAREFATKSYSTKECVQKYKFISTYYEPYKNISECKEKKPTNSTQKATYYCQEGIEMYLDGNNVGEQSKGTNKTSGNDCFRTKSECEQNFNEKKVQLMPRYNLSSCILVK